jgi:hypothetical protein
MRGGGVELVVMTLEHSYAVMDSPCKKQTRGSFRVLIAQHPELLATPEEHDGAHHPLRAARHVLLAVREVHYALDSYRAILPDAPGFLAGAGADDDFPF